MIVIVIYSCGNNDSDLRSLTEQENEELFQKNNQLILRLQKQNEILKSKQDSLNSNIDDLRESPAKYIAQKVLQDSNNEIHFIVEPNIEEHNVFKLTDYETALEEADIIAFLVAHNEFKNLKLSEDKTLLDFCGIYK